MAWFMEMGVLWGSTEFGVETEEFGSETEIDGMMLESRAEAATADVETDQECSVGVWAGCEIEINGCGVRVLVRVDFSSLRLRV